MAAAGAPDWRHCCAAAYAATALPGASVAARANALAASAWRPAASKARPRSRNTGARSGASRLAAVNSSAACFGRPRSRCTVPNATWTSALPVTFSSGAW